MLPFLKGAIHAWLLTGNLQQHSQTLGGILARIKCCHAFATPLGPIHHSGFVMSCVFGQSACHKTCWCKCIFEAIAEQRKILNFVYDTPNVVRLPFTLFISSVQSICQLAYSHWVFSRYVGVPPLHLRASAVEDNIFPNVPTNFDFTKNTKFTYQNLPIPHFFLNYLEIQ